MIEKFLSSLNVSRRNLKQIILHSSTKIFEFLLHILDVLLRNRTGLISNFCNQIEVVADREKRSFQSHKFFEFVIFDFSLDRHSANVSACPQPCRLRFLANYLPFFGSKPYKFLDSIFSVWHISISFMYFIVFQGCP